MHRYCQQVRPLSTCLKVLLQLQLTNCLAPSQIDRKTDFVFSIKDFIYTHEPSSWRFDVTEELNGYPQVVDFTDDTTGAPHDVAKSNMSMYVNEVGHNEKLVENIEVSR